MSEVVAQVWTVDQVSNAAGLIARREILLSRKLAAAAAGTNDMGLLAVARHLGRMSEVEGVLRAALVPMIDEEILTIETALAKLGIANPTASPVHPVDALPAAPLPLAVP